MKDLIKSSNDDLSRMDLSNPEHESPAMCSWQDMVAGPMRDGDLEAMKSNGLIAAQLNMLHLAHNGDTDTVKYNATAFLLSQSGHGPMSRVEHVVDYRKLPSDQLKSVILSKLSSIAKRNPNFDIAGLISSAKDAVSSSDMNTDIEVTDFVSRETFEEEFE